MIEIYETTGERDSAEYLGSWADGEITEDPEGKVKELFGQVLFFGDYDEDSLLERFSGPFVYAVRVDEATDRAMASAVPEGAVNISSPQDAPAGTQVIQGPRGGWWYVPIQGEPTSDEKGTSTPAGESEQIEGIVAEADEILASDDPAFVKRNRISRLLNDVTGVPLVDLPRFEDYPEDGTEPILQEENIRAAVRTLARAGEAGLTQNVTQIGKAMSGELGGAYATYNYSGHRLLVWDDLNVGLIQGNEQNGFTVADGIEWLYLHELGHGQHKLALDANDDLDVPILGASVSVVPGVTEWDEERTRRRLDAAEDDVSRYARTNAAEFVAEVFAGLALGKDFPEQVMTMYDEFGGPDSWRDYRERFHPDGYDPERTLADAEAPTLPESAEDVAIEAPESLPDPFVAEARETARSIFEDPDREMASQVPAGAINIPDPSAAPPGTQVVQGPRGGWWYVPGPGAQGGSESGSGGTGAQRPEVSEPSDMPAALEAMGAERVGSYEVGDRLALDFQLPMPGEDPPQRSSFAFYPDGSVEGTLRLGILDRDAMGGHASRSEEATRRLAEAVARAEPPAGAPVQVDFGDFHYPPRPHVRFTSREPGGVFADKGGQVVQVQEGDRLEASPADLLAFTERVARSVYEEFDGEWEAGGSEPPTPAEAGGGGQESVPEIEVVSADPSSFVQGVLDFIEADPEMGSFLTEHTAEELASHEILMHPSGQAGVSVSPEGDIQNLFNLGAPSGTGRALIESAIERGARTLDCYDGFLPELYRKFGFRETGRMTFNPEYAPEGWNEERFGQPDVVFMHYDPESDYEISDTMYEGDEWDDAKADSRDRAAWGDSPLAPGDDA